MVVTCSSGMLIDFQWMIQHYIPEDRTLHYHLCEYLKSYKIMMFWHMAWMVEWEMDTEFYGKTS
jgi:hypothetical protein